MAGYGPAGGNGAKPVLLLMDSPRKQDGQRAPWSTAADDRDQEGDAPRKLSVGALQKAALVGGAGNDVMRLATQMTANPPESLGRLLVEVTAQVQDERSRRSDVEKKNQSLMLEIEQLQRELLDLKTAREQQTRRRASGDWDAATRSDVDAVAELSARDSDTGDAELWRRELQDARRAKDAALADAHRLALEVLELQACISMQHDELRALRASDADVRGALVQAEDGAKELRAQHTILVQENQLLKDEVAHLNSEIGKRGSHFKALLDKWTESQAQCEHVERENRAMLDKMKELRARHEQLQRETLQARDERDALQHQAHHLKGAVAAKAAEAKAFQAYGSNARDHLQAQQAAIQRHAIYRRKVHHVACDSALLVAGIKTTLAAVRAPLVAIQHDFRTFLRHLQAPVMSLVARSRRFAEVAHIEHTPLRAALAHAELARRHLHEQLWRARRNALLVCQIRNLVAPTPSGSTADAILGSADVGASGTPAPPPKRALRANYATSELLLRESERDTVTVMCDAVFSDRARGGGCWNHHESVAPLLQSVLDGFNGCVATFDGLPPLKLGAEDATVSVPELVLSQLFALLYHGGAHLHRVKLTISFLGVYNETIFDLLGLDASAAAAAPSMSKIVVLEVQNAEEALLVLRGGGENLDAAHDAGVLDKFLTHKVITVCVAHENLLLSAPASVSTKSKLQIVELATGAPQPEGDANAPNAGWEDRSRVKAQVAMENGVQALLTTLADVRVAADASGGGVGGATGSGSASSSSGAFVRYHSSKLTVLLQDTVKASAKFLGIAALPGAASSGPPGASPQLDARAAQATRWLFHIRNAVGSAASSGGTMGTHGSSDRSVEGFINRLTSHQSHTDGPGAKTSAGLAFASSEMADRPPLVADVDPRRWEKELERMNRRYGDLSKFTTTFYHPGEENGASTSRRRRSCDDDDGFQATGTLSPRRPSTTVTCVEQLTDVVIRPEELVSLEGTNGVQPPPAPATKPSRSKSKPGSKVYRGVPGHRNGSKAHARATLSASSADKSKRRGTVTTVATSASSDATPMATTLAPRVAVPQRATSIVKLRRETASSVLKKVLGGSSASKQRAHAASASYHHASSLTSGHAPVPVATSTMTATTATQARLQNRKIPFK